MQNLMRTQPLTLAENAMDALTIDGLKCYYVNDYFGVRREIRAVDDISLTIRKNEIYGIAGESSSGKTSLIKTLAGAIRPPMRVVGGTVKFNFADGPIDVYGEPGKMKAARWRHLSYIMQGSMNVLNPVRRVKHAFTDFASRHMNLDPAATAHRFKGAKSRAEKEALADIALQRVGLSMAEIKGRFSHELSGGQLQRIAVARALIPEPKLIVADEPVSMVDASLRMSIVNLFRDLRDALNVSIVYITHDLATAYYISDRVVIMRKGVVVESGDARDVLEHPKHVYSIALKNAVLPPNPREASAILRLRQRNAETNEATSGSGDRLAR
ncbi:ABC transporter ATP-binding protein [Rhizobium leguminosarum]|uniref:ATP-binding cassette domain-containing protein n=1 Tax=Rhizobium leguminosarum TaxID=384 RepID=UPI001C951953|nr:ABC transporter ATP-binding protein [Rhizobium leguminosarum]MBY5605320.1 ABC transporter ATP-binding protein [Rhizobium leguminosarum]